MVTGTASLSGCLNQDILIDQVISELDRVNDGSLGHVHKLWLLTILRTHFPELGASNAKNLFLKLARFTCEYRNDLFPHAYIKAFERSISLVSDHGESSTALGGWDVVTVATYVLIALGEDGREAFRRFLVRERVLERASKTSTSPRSAMRKVAAKPGRSNLVPLTGLSADEHFDPGHQPQRE